MMIYDMKLKIYLFMKNTIIMKKNDFMINYIHCNHYSTMNISNEMKNISTKSETSNNYLKIIYIYIKKIV